MLHLIAQTTRLSDMLFGGRSLTLPSVDTERVWTGISAKTADVFKGSILYDFWKIYETGLE